MITPINNHILIQPLRHETFVSMGKETFEEVGIVQAIADGIDWIKEGDYVYFDGWLSAKFPSPQKEGEYFWLVRAEDIRAIKK